MNSIRNQIAQRVREATRRIGAEGDPLVRPAQDEKFGDYQSNCAMGLAKRLGKKPRDVATAIVDALEIEDMCEKPDIAGPGFINFKLKPEYLAGCLESIPAPSEAGGDRLGISPAANPQVIVLDISSPNLAKEMHVGHLRSTVIGDCLARVLEFEGHTVHRENHVGDWGTQFGMLVAHLRRVDPDVVRHPEELVISDLESFYVDAKSRFDTDDEFKTESRETVVALQQGDETTRRIWRAFCDESLRHCHAIYDRLDVKLVDRGESFYADRMEDVIRRLESMTTAGDKGLVRISDGALCVFMEGFKTREGDPLPMIVRKSDGGYNYATSDLATILHRVEELGASRILYVVGIGQKQHFDMLFAAVRALGWAKDDASLLHIGFGNMLAASGKPFKTREGGTVKLKDLLDEAVQRAREVVSPPDDDQPGERDRQFDKAQVAQIAETVGLAAMKYFDLSHSLSSDYKFDLGTMLSLEGNTAPYMLYAYARIRSIGRKAGVEFDDLPRSEEILLEHPAEIALAKRLLQFAEVLDDLSRELRPNVMTDYLYSLAKAFSRFYDKKLGVRVIDASPEDVRLSRLHLCELTARTLKLGLSLLGIKTLEEM
ncbi:MAG: arginine--tRNA ligase [Phycisphaerales bacterium]|nr:MAG: arginine--tRNA ligase [Phycisphaerales bacterium]